jgi:hypothetical protein
MKRLLTFTTLCALIFLPLSTEAYVKVKGYYRKDGTYVAPHVRSNPNGLKYDNYGYTPSQGLYNDTYGTRGTTWDTPTYITDPDYYEGKTIYDSTHNTTNTYVPTPSPYYGTVDVATQQKIKDLIAQIATLQTQLNALKAAQGIR